MKRGRSRVVCAADFMDKIFEKKVHLQRWCHLWDFNPDFNLPALNNKMPDPNTDQYMYHWALRRDFPTYMKKIILQALPGIFGL